MKFISFEKKNKFHKHINDKVELKIKTICCLFIESS